MQAAAVYFLASAASTAATDPKPVRAAVVWLVLLIAVLGLFVIGVAVLTIARHLRRPGRKAGSSPQPLDAWQEAGRRLKVDDGEPTE